jgi:hypothetical protein
MVPDKPKQAWALAAHKTRQEISALQRANRELGLKELADKSRLNPQTLRRRVSALDFLERFEHETKIKSAVLSGRRHRVFVSLVQPRPGCCQKGCNQTDRRQHNRGTTPLGREAVEDVSLCRNW